MGNCYLSSKMKFTLLLSLFCILGSSSMAAGFTFGADTLKRSNTKADNKITDSRTDKPAALKSGVKANIKPFKPLQDRSSSPGEEYFDFDEDKIINNVKIYPNPVSDQLNLTYNVTRDSNITIKVMDVLGNEVITLLSQRMAAGEQSNSFSIASKLNSGFYFVRFIVGNETVVKRISVL